MASTLLQLIQTACRKLALPVPTEVVSSTNPQTLQLKEILQEVGNDLVTDHDWSNRVARHNFVGSGAIAQTALPTDYKRFSSLQRLRLGGHLQRLDGPLPFDEWDKVQVYDYVLSWPVWTFINGNISIYPAPPATDTFYFTYMSSYWVLDTDGTTWKAAFAADTDTTAFDDQLMLYGLYWRWKEAKGFDYDEDYNRFERLKKQLIGADRGPKIVEMSFGAYDVDSLPVEVVV